MADIPLKLGIPDWEFRVILGRTKIEYDQDKEEENRRKHGYSLESGVELLVRIIMPIGVKPPFTTSDGFMEGGEVRHMHMGLDDSGKVVLTVTTMRLGETVRIISYRRASPEEREQFYRQYRYLSPAARSTH